MKKSIFYFCIALLLSSFSFNAQAQCTVPATPVVTNTFQNTTPNQYIGQSFTADCSGEITEISVGLHSNAQAQTGATFYLENGADSDLSTFAYSEMVNIPAGSVSNTYTLTLSTPFPVVSGQVYSMYFLTTANLRMNTQTLSDTYAGGGLIYSPNATQSPTPNATLDTDFNVVISAVPLSIPTLSQWGLIILALLLLTLGTLFLLQPSFRSQIERQ